MSSTPEAALLRSGGARRFSTALLTLLLNDNMTVDELRAALSSRGLEPGEDSAGLLVARLVAAMEDEEDDETDQERKSPV